MREQTLPRLKSQTGFLPGRSLHRHYEYDGIYCAAGLMLTLCLSASAGMLKRTKYSRLRNDSLTSLEDHPQRMLFPLKRDLSLDSDPVQLDSGTPTHHLPSTLRDVIPRVANIRLQSLRGHTACDSGHNDNPSSLGSGSSERLCGQPSVNVPLSAGQNFALQCTKRPITLHRMASIPWTPGCPPCSHRPGVCCLKTSSAIDECTVVGMANRAVHHHIKVPLPTHVNTTSDLLCSTLQQGHMGLFFMS